MKNILAILLSLLAGGEASSVPLVAYEYVSVDCPEGDITLKLETTGVFLLVLKHWDAKLSRHTSSETLSGNWSISGRQLSLSGSSNVVYKREPTAMTVGPHSASIDGFVWVQSSAPTFADKYDLVEKSAMDDLFHRATSP